MRHHRPDAYSAEQVLLNKRQIYGGAPKLHWYPPPLFSGGPANFDIGQFPNRNYIRNINSNTNSAENRRQRQIRVLVQFSWATSDLWLIQQNKFYWISHRSMVAQLNCTVTQISTMRSLSALIPISVSGRQHQKTNVEWSTRAVCSISAACRTATSSRCTPPGCRPWNACSCWSRRATVRCCETRSPTWAMSETSTDCRRRSRGWPARTHTNRSRTTQVARSVPAVYPSLDRLPS